MPEQCELKGCVEPLGPGCSKIGYTGEGDKLDEVKVCATHTWQIMTAPRGTFQIMPDRELKAMPASPRIII